jgi:hypothetical protein
MWYVQNKTAISNREMKCFLIVVYFLLKLQLLITKVKLNQVTIVTSHIVPEEIFDGN